MIALTLTELQAEQVLAAAACEGRGWIEMGGDGDLRPTRAGVDTMLRATAYSTRVKEFVRSYMATRGRERLVMAVLLGFAWNDVSELERWAGEPLSDDEEERLELLLASGGMPT